MFWQVGNALNDFKQVGNALNDFKNIQSFKPTLLAPEDAKIIAKEFLKSFLSELLQHSTPITSPAIPSLMRNEMCQHANQVGAVTMVTIFHELVLQAPALVMTRPPSQLPTSWPILFSQLPSTSPLQLHASPTSFFQLPSTSLHQLPAYLPTLLSQLLPWLLPQLPTSWPTSSSPHQLPASLPTSLKPNEEVVQLLTGNSYSTTFLTFC